HPGSVNEFDFGCGGSG
nr:Chain B, Dense granule protein 6, HF10 peptide [Toxoplasma gondii]8D5N_E Chain E, Dense granule protein 6, HF10 peptide [Toxoplasma gondii]